MTIHNHAELSIEQLAKVADEIWHLARLSDVLKWCASRPSAVASTLTVAQDEFSQDVVIPYIAGFSLVFGVT